jgi:hypothetical protein
MKDSALRGYAAVGLGICARSMPTGESNQGEIGRDKIIEALAKRMLDYRETLEVRSAAAVGLGLCARQKHMPAFKRAAGQLRPRQHQSLIGYIILARGMIGDEEIIKPAGKFLSLKNEDTSMSGILGRRAAALGLGVLGKDKCIDVLKDAWHLNYYVNREVALALAFCGPDKVAETLIDEMTESDKPLVRAFMARCLGELFTAKRPPRMARFIIASNYAMKNEARLRYQMMANEFLFRYLIPASGREWQ